MNFVVPKLEVLDLSNIEVCDETLCDLKELLWAFGTILGILFSYYRERCERCGRKLIYALLPALFARAQLKS